MNRKQRTWYITHKDMIYGLIEFGDCFEIDSDRIWKTLQSRHHWNVDHRPYSRTVAHTILAVRRLDMPIRFTKVRCAIGTVIYRDAAQPEPGPGQSPVSGSAADTKRNTGTTAMAMDPEPCTFQVIQAWRVGQGD